MECASESQFKKWKGPSKNLGTGPSTQYRNFGDKMKLPIPANTQTQVNTKNALVEHRRALGLCLKCGDKYYPGHQCREKNLGDLLLKNVDNWMTWV